MTLPNFTSQQWDELIEQYADLCIDSMDHKDMYRFVRQTLIEDFGQIQSRHELCEDIRLTFDDETLDDLVDSVTELTTQEQVDYINSNLKEVN
tara:strand:+ start:1140 stop:1418 length:279 start_codon:yes stop_codon:yes gene_type:complete